MGKHILGALESNWNNIEKLFASKEANHVSESLDMKNALIVPKTTEE
jgi:hypothetical protein